MIKSTVSRNVDRLASKIFVASSSWSGLAIPSIVLMLSKAFFKARWNDSRLYRYIFFAIASWWMSAGSFEEALCLSSSSVLLFNSFLMILKLFFSQTDSNFFRRIWKRKIFWITYSIVANWYSYYDSVGKSERFWSMRSILLKDWCNSRSSFKLISVSWGDWFSSSDECRDGIVFHYNFWETKA